MQLQKQQAYRERKVKEFVYDSIDGFKKLTYVDFK